jgi:hypothetical protein
MTEINRPAHMAKYPQDPMKVHWYARPDDTIGGWCVIPVDEHPSEGCYTVAAFIGEQEARHIAELHNRWLDLTDVGQRIAQISRWIDQWPHNATRDPEALTWMRLAKITEEAGEVITAYIACNEGNPRKPNRNPQLTIADVMTELLDVALTALCAYEHLEGEHGTCMQRFAEHVDSRLERAGLCVDP